MIMMGVFIKGGPVGNLYNYYSDGLIVNSDGNLHAPINPKNGDFYGLSHVSFCYIPGKPEIDITKTCEGGVLTAEGNAIEYDYKLVVENTGTLPLYDILAKDTTAGDEFTLESLAPGETKEFTGSFITDTNGIKNEAEVSAAVEGGGAVVASDEANFDCPVIEIPGKLNVTKSCTTVVVQNDYGHYGLAVNYSGDVCNDSAVLMKGVKVVEMNDSGMETFNIGDLAPGACADFEGRYVPKPVLGELPEEGVTGDQVGKFVDKVQATGTTFFGEVVESMYAEASCKLCPDCPDCPVH
ncbi:hypothetical protein EGH82_17365 [Vibrio ponticus]|uniref:DUF7507 domain-containing protein n=1 Tax=Vibrio ponticus TaxID=265668 RepID=A0A3N3DWA6_9VIBR|nr:hypothetical protein EGH82_17365 [Vibrio ponticus]